MSNPLEYRAVSDKLQGIRLDIEAMDFGEVEEMQEVKEAVMDYVSAAQAAMTLMYTITALCEMTGTDMESQAVRYFAEMREENG